MLAAFLYGNFNWDILFSSYLMHSEYDLFQNLTKREEDIPNSFWIRKTRNLNNKKIQKWSQILELTGPKSPCKDIITAFFPPRLPKKY